MSFVTEHSTQQDGIAIVQRVHTRFGAQLAAYIESKDTKAITTSSLPARPDGFSLTFVLLPKATVASLPEYTQNPIVLVVVNNPTRAHKLSAEARAHPTRNVRIVHLPSDTADAATIEQIIWFAYADSSEVLFDVVLNRPSEDMRPQLSQRFIRPLRRSKRRLAMVALGLWIAYMLIVLGGMYATTRWRLYTHLKAQNAAGASQIYTVFEHMYQPVRPLFFLFSLGLPADSLANTNRAITSLTAAETTTNLSLSALTHSVLDQSSQTPLSIDAGRRDVQATIGHIDRLLNQPDWILTQSHDLLAQLNDRKILLQRSLRIMHVLPQIFAANESRRVAIVLADGRHMSAGGGRVYAVAIASLRGGRLETIKTYSASSIDRELATSIPAPESVKTYMNRSFLSMSNSLVEPQLDGNAQTIQTLLAAERGEGAVDGYLLVSISALKKILGAESIYLPQSQEKITADSLALKLDKNRDNEAFAIELIDRLVAHIATTQARTMIPVLDSLFMEKQLAFLDSGTSASVFQDLYWDGQLVSTRCVINDPNCVVDVLGVYETNTTADYDNSLVRQSKSLKTTISETGVVRNELTITLTNDPQSIAYPPQTYTSFYQLILPRNTVVESMTDNLQPITQVLSRQAGYTLVAFPVTAAAQQSRYITVTYTHPKKLQLKNGAYQLILQKQLGSPNSDFTFELIHPKSWSPIEQNFDPVVNNNRIFYNNFQSTDRIFIITLKHTP